MRFKTLLFIILLLITGDLLCLSFWNFPQRDDYILNFLYHHLGFWGVQSWIYHNNTGRYFSSFIGAVFASKGFLYAHYYLHSQLLIMGTIAGMIFMSRRLLKRLLNYSLSYASALLYSLVFFLVFLSIAPEVSTALFWFSSSVTYQTGNILLLFFIGSVVEVVYPGNSFRRTIFAVVSAGLIFLIMGTNELSALLVSFLFIPVIWMLWRRRRVSAPVSLVWILTLGLSLFFLFHAPGIALRTRSIPVHNPVSAIGSALFWLATSFWFSFKVPLFWFFEIDMFFIGTLFKSDKPAVPLEGFINLPIKKMITRVLLTEIVALIPILYAMNGSLPLRGLNTIVFINLILMTGLSFFLGRRNSGPEIGFFSRLLPKMKYILYILVIFANPFFYQLIQTNLSGYFYHQVMRQNIRILQQSEDLGLKSAHVPDFDTAMIKILNAEFGKNLRSIVKNEIIQKPSLIYFNYSGGKSFPDSYLLDYYGLDSLYIGNHLFTKKILNREINLNTQ